MKTIRIGKIAYTNVLPIFTAFDETGLSIEWCPLVPAQLNRSMQQGTIDIAPVSAFAYGQHYDKYDLIPDISISSHGAVGSIFLFSSFDRLEDLDRQPIALTNTSATSIHLLKVILEKYVGVQPDYHVMTPDLHEMLKVSKAALLIGDDAILSAWHHPEIKRFDLGEEWLKYTRLGMTYAVWAVRKELLNEQPDDVSEVAKRFLQAKYFGVQNLEKAVQYALKLGGTTDFWKSYFHGLCYDFGKSEQDGLATYFQLVYELGYLSESVPIQTLEI
ncbi:futalosine synthase [Seinonella peptonophila]|uniref:Chorismate dehydratase n=1 Tax=Seinonella peptonophila TaxID=112248 RepID=A0A1M4TFS4_9BACL|nr:menaquinone biosynthesis protein [Seinonella peptonophila]SHE43291.1 futalosine synthase [Seinonella peptonophila]